MATVKLFNHGARIVTIHLAAAGRVDLAPRLNPVPSEAWEEIQAARKKNKALDALFNREAMTTVLGDGHLEFQGTMTEKEAAAIAPPPASNREDDDDGLSDMTVEDAKETIGETLAIEQLRAWRRGEVAGKNRKGILDALDAQIAKISA